MTKNQAKFINFLKTWYSENWNKSRNDFAKFVGVSYSQISNMLSDNPKKGGCEETRIKICKKIGVDYRSLIDCNDTYSNHEEKTPKTSEQQKPFGRTKTGKLLVLPNENNRDHPRLKVCMENLRMIFESGHDDLIGAIDANLSAFKASVDDRSRIKALEDKQLSQAKEIESLKHAINSRSP